MVEPAEVIGRGLGKSFRTATGTVQAVRDLSVTVQPGEIVGLLGPNGAGKTTTLRLLSTLEVPSAGWARVAGHDLRLDPRGVRAAIGVVAQGSGTRPPATPLDELSLQARLYRVPRPVQRAAELLDAFGLAEAARRPTMTLSGGQRRRLDLALGLVHRPRVLFLDEPTAGLDPAARAELWRLVRELRDHRGLSVLLSTHYLDEADALCDQILIMDRGSLIAAGSPAAVRRSVGSETAVLQLPPDEREPPPDERELLPDGRAGERSPARSAGGTVDVARRALAGLPAVRGVHVDGSTVRVRCADAGGLLGTLVLALDRAGVPLLSASVERPSLDDAFLALTDHRL